MAHLQGCSRESQKLSIILSWYFWFFSLHICCNCLCSREDGGAQLIHLLISLILQISSIIKSTPTSLLFSRRMILLSCSLLKISWFPLKGFNKIKIKILTLYHDKDTVIFENHFNEPNKVYKTTLIQLSFPKKLFEDVEDVPAGKEPHSFKVLGLRPENLFSVKFSLGLYQLFLCKKMLWALMDLIVKHLQEW